MPRPRALSDQAIAEIKATRKYAGRFKRAPVSLAALAKRYQVSVPLISKTLAGKVSYAKKAAPSDVVKTVNLPGRRDPQRAPVRRAPKSVAALMPIIVCYPESGMHYLVDADSVEGFAKKYEGMAAYPCKHLAGASAKRPLAKEQRAA